MKKKILSLLSIVVLLTSMLNPPMEAEAATEMQPYKYWATAISTNVKLLGGGMSYSIGSGSNFTPDSSIQPGYPYNEYIEGTINSNDYLPAEFARSDNREILSYDEYEREANGQWPENKDSRYLSDRNLRSVYNGGKTLPLRYGDWISGNRYSVTAEFPDKSTAMDKLVYNDNDGDKTGDKRTYYFDIIVIIKIYHEKFDPSTGEWDIDSDVRANLSIRENSPARWNYKDFDNGFDTDYSVYMDASSSYSARPRVTYDYDIGIDGNYVGDRSSNSNTYVYNDRVYPSDLTGIVRQNGNFPVSGSVYVEDDRGEGKYAYDNTRVNYSIENRAPLANASVVDKGKNSSQYLYAKRPVVVKDTSSDYENELTELEYKIKDKTTGQTVASWNFDRVNAGSAWEIKAQSFNATHVDSMILNENNLTSEITFNKDGLYEILTKWPRGCL